MHSLLTCEDVLPRILELLIVQGEEGQTKAWEHLDNPELPRITNSKSIEELMQWSPKQTMMTFMLVSRPFLEVGRRALYKEPRLHCWNIMDERLPLFQGTILYLNPHLGTYVRRFSAATA